MGISKDLKVSITLDENRQRFFDLTTKIMIAELPKPGTQRHKEINRAYIDKLLGHPGEPIAAPVSSPRSKFLGALFWGNSEILKSYHVIKHARQYFNRPPKGSTAERSDYFSFVIHAYLNELYILESRMVSYLKVLRRVTAKGSAIHVALIAAEPNLKQSISEAFSGPRQLRGSHVHESRFEDEDISRLASLELMRYIPDIYDVLKAHHTGEVRRVRNYWDQKFQENEQAIDGLLGLYYSALLGVVFEGNGQLRSY